MDLTAREWHALDLIQTKCIHKELRTQQLPELTTIHLGDQNLLVFLQQRSKPIIEGEQVSEMNMRNTVSFRLELQGRCPDRTVRGAPPNDE